MTRDLSIRTIFLGLLMAGLVLTTSAEAQLSGCCAADTCADAKANAADPGDGDPCVFPAADDPCTEYPGYAGYTSVNAESGTVCTCDTSIGCMDAYVDQCAGNPTAPECTGL